MDEKPLITVIVPVYNIPDCLPRCVRSITAQTYHNLEIILVDDGSDDGTAELCDQLAREDDRIVVYHRENGGTSRARNLGLEKARGKYVGFVDSDDFISPDMYERLYWGIRHFHVPAAQIARDERDEGGIQLSNICEPPEEPVVVESRGFLKELLLHRGDCSLCTKLIRRDLFPREAFPAGKLNEDFNLMVRMLAGEEKPSGTRGAVMDREAAGSEGTTWAMETAGSGAYRGIDRIASLPWQCYHVFYRMGSNSRKADRTDFSRVYADCVENADLVAGIVEKDYPELADTAFRFGIFQRLEYMLHIPISQMTKENAFYREIVSYLRRNWFRSMRNPVLTGKNKLYHTLFALLPRGIRKLHAYLRLRER